MRAQDHEVFAAAAGVLLAPAAKFEEVPELPLGDGLFAWARAGL